MVSKYEYTKKAVEERRTKLDRLKNKPCARCKKKFPPYVMEWHHRDPTTKKFGIGQGSFRNSMAKILEEIRKCDLYCANCHRITEYENNFRFRKGDEKNSFAG